MTPAASDNREASAQARHRNEGQERHKECYNTDNRGKKESKKERKKDR